MRLSEFLAVHPHLDMDVANTDDGALVVDAVLLLRDVDMMTTHDRIGVWSSDGLGGVIQYGIVCSAKLQLERFMWQGLE